jgi:predicted TIM-barrel fold metal-dependent hydrolase
LDDYLNQVVRPTLRQQKQGGAVALKFEVAYLRALDFGPASHDAAAEAYRRNVNIATPNSSEYRVLQDFLFHEVALEAGKLGLAVHIHTGAGCGEFFNDAGSDPMLLQHTVNDPTLRGTNFVLLHGGNPFSRHLTSMILKPNVYTDMSVLELEFSPSELARILRPWLEFMPERVLYGTDAGSFGPGMEWVETTWLGSHNARRALGTVLTDMVKDGTITMPRAKEIASLVLRDNAAKLYHLAGAGTPTGSAN